MSLISVFLGVSTAVLLLRYLKKMPIFREIIGSNDGTIYPPLSVIIPACNEEKSIGEAVRRLMNYYPHLEVIVVIDRSTDNTALLLEKLKVEYPQLKVVTISDLPPNWLGKNHAVYRGEKEATGEWLLFTDADVMFSSSSLKVTIRYAMEKNLDHLAIVPDLYYGSVLHRAFLAYFSLAFISVAMITNKVGVGAFNLVKKSVYQAIGGYEAIPMQVIDDMSLGTSVVDKGYK
ncbi:glycosyltransferase family 2 protein [Desulfosporosinus sp.]|uniref:glycosyltransferase n=1 Tax=Desulfosporosinus sp. TaxID=157907 RepID=UPI00345B6DDD